MKLHATAVDKIIRLVDTYHGSNKQEKLIRELSNLELTPYEQKLAPGGNIVLVLTEDYEAQLRTSKSV